MCDSSCRLNGTSRISANLEGIAAAFAGAGYHRKFGVDMASSNRCAFTPRDETGSWLHGYTPRNPQNGGGGHRDGVAVELKANKPRSRRNRTLDITLTITPKDPEPKEPTPWKEPPPSRPALSLKEGTKSRKVLRGQRSTLSKKNRSTFEFGPRDRLHYSHSRDGFATKGGEERNLVRSTEVTEATGHCREEITQSTRTEQNCEAGSHVEVAKPIVEAPFATTTQKPAGTAAHATLLSSRSPRGPVAAAPDACGKPSPQDDTKPRVPVGNAAPPSLKLRIDASCPALQGFPAKKVESTYRRRESNASMMNSRSTLRWR